MIEQLPQYCWPESVYLDDYTVVYLRTPATDSIIDLGYTEDRDLAGIYTVTLTKIMTGYTDYTKSENVTFTQQEKFKVEMVDPCPQTAMLYFRQDDMLVWVEGDEVTASIM